MLHYYCCGLIKIRVVDINRYIIIIIIVFLGGGGDGCDITDIIELIFYILNWTDFIFFFSFCQLVLVRYVAQQTATNHRYYYIIVLYYVIIRNEEIKCSIENIMTKFYSK